MRPLVVSRLNWVWEKPLGVVFDSICSGEQEHFRGWCSSKTTLPACRILGEEEGETGSLLASMIHGGLVALWLHTPTDIGPQITRRTLFSQKCLCMMVRKAEKVQSQGRIIGSPFSGEGKGSAPDTVMHCHLTPLAVVVLSFLLNPKGANLDQG